MNEAAEQASQQPVGGGMTKAFATRERYWEEADTEQKIERLRDTVAMLCRETTALSAAVQRLAAHSHGDNGLLVPIHMVEGANYGRNSLAGAVGGGLYAHDNGIPHGLRTKHERR